MVNARSKGYRREAKTREIYEDAGFVVETFISGGRYNRTDGFGWVDFLAVRPNEIRFVQVTSNAAHDVGTIAEWAAEHAPDNLTADEVVWHDREGARLLVCHADHPRNRLVPVDERESDCNMGDELREYLSETPPRD